MSSGYQALDVESSHGSSPRGESSRAPQEQSVPSLASVTGALVRGHGSLLTALSVPSLVLIGFCTIVLLLVISFASFKYSKSSGCLGAPYLYVTHSNEHNIMQLTRDGCLNTNKVLFGVPSGKSQLRSMTMGQYKGEPAIYVADAHAQASQVNIFGDCSYWTGMRHYKGSAFTKDGPFSAGAVHAYGIAFDDGENLYASFQHTNVVLRATKDTFDVFPENINEIQHRKILDFTGINNQNVDVDLEGRDHSGPFVGTFYQFGNASVQNMQDQGVRSIAWTQTNAGGQLWINNEFDNAIYIVDSTGTPIKILSVNKPVGSFHNKDAQETEERQVVYIGSRGDKTGSVYAYDIETFEVVRKYSMIGMVHPTGITVHDGILFVADQSLGAILTFDVHSTRFIKNIWERHSGGDIEQLTMSNC